MAKKRDETDLLMEVRSYFRESKDFYGEINLRKAKDYDYYEGQEQTWTKAEEEQRQAQGRPTIRKPQIHSVVDLLEGLERQTRLEVVMKPRSESDVPVADAYSKGFTYVSDQNKLDFKVSKAFGHALKGGAGWLIPIRNPDPLKEEIMIQVESAFRVWPDPNSEADDLSDARYILYLKWVPLVVAQAVFPEHAEYLEGMVKSRLNYEEESLLGVSRPHVVSEDYPDVSEMAELGDFVDARARHVLLVECWRREYVPVTVMVYPDDRKEELHASAVKKNGDIDPTYLTEAQKATLYGDPLMGMPPVEGVEIVQGHTDKVHMTTFSGDVILWDGPSPYKHGQFPFIPIWAYKRRSGETYGVVRNLIGLQDEINVHASQALHILNTVRVFLKKSAPMKRRQVADEAARPDGIFEINGPDDIAFQRDENALKDHILLQQDSKLDMRESSGINAELLGTGSDAKSAVAMRERQKQGTMRVASIFDYLRMARQMLGEQVCSLMAQYWSPSKLVRITEESRYMEQQASSFRPIQGMDGYTPLDPAQINLEQARFNVVVEETPAFGTNREGQLEMMKGIVQELPFIAQFIAPDLIRATDLPNKEWLAQKVEMMTGMAQMGMAGGPGAQGHLPPGQGVPGQAMDPTQELDTAFQQLLAQGMSPEQAYEVLMTQLAGQQAA